MPFKRPKKSAAKRPTKRVPKATVAARARDGRRSQASARSPARRAARPGKARAPDRAGGRAAERSPKRSAKRSPKRSAEQAPKRSPERAPERAQARASQRPEPRAQPKPPKGVPARAEDLERGASVGEALELLGDEEVDEQADDAVADGDSPWQRAGVVEDEEDLLDDEVFEGQQGETAPDTEPEAPDTLERDPHARPPVVAIVGRPNVGKSTLLNALSGSRIAIVEPTPGVTRDRVGVLCTLADRTVELVDTGGIGIVDVQGLEEDVERQVAVALAQAAVILFVVDAREGRAPLDERVAGMLRRARDRVILVANKAETERIGWNASDFEPLGYGTPLTISAQERYNLEELEALLAAKLPSGPTTPRRLEPPLMKLAIVGRVNAGKSSLVNALLRQNRMIVSSVPGTTRDTVDVRFERDGKTFVVIDTAGIRKEKAVSGGVEFYAQRRAERAMRRADVSALVLDATSDVSRLDRQIAGYAVEHHHPVVLVVNKWDLRPAGLTTSTYGKYLRATLRGLTYAPIVFTTATTGRNVDTVIDVARGLFRQANTRITTAVLNKAIQIAQQLRHPRPRHGALGQIYYGTQVEVNPPTFVMFVNDPNLYDSTYRRYLENRFRAHLGLPEVPMRVFFKSRDRRPSRLPTELPEAGQRESGQPD